MEEISKKSTKKILEFCQKCVSRAYIIFEDFLLWAQTIIYRPNSNNRVLSRAQGSCNKVKFQ